MRRIRTILLRAAIIGGSLAVVGFVFAVLAWTSYPRRIDISPPFIAGEIEIRALDYYDLGAVDFNRDGHLDIYTTNHSSKQSLLLSDARGGHAERLSALGMDQDAAYPGLEDIGRPPANTAAGLHIYFVDSTLHLRHAALPDARGFSGSLLIPGEPRVESGNGFRIETSPAGQYTNINFSTDEAGQLRLRVTKSAPIKIKLHPDTATDTVFIGSNGIHPDASEIDLFLKDRHGIAWADINRDGRMDAYMSRGALFGSLANLPGDFADQLFLSSDDSGYSDQFSAAGFRKSDCPARQVAWTDANDDGLLDMYVACGRQVGGFWEYVPVALRRDRSVAPNLLFVQTPDHRFQESAARYGLDFPVGGTFLWLDPDNDGDSDLLWASETDISLYRNTDAAFAAEELLPGSTTTQPRKLAAGDFDADGDIDVFVAASFGSTLLLNRDGKLDAVNPGDYGLPTKVRTAAWVDFDSDGYLDMYVWPDGLYQQSSSGGFEETGLLQMPSPYWALVDPRALWFDIDNDGDRDFLLMQRFFPQVLQEKFPNAMPFTTDLAINNSPPADNRFSVDLVGDLTNIDAIGASVTMHTSDGTIRQEVGQSDSSHYSQGHYRLYFSAPESASVSHLDIAWPDDSRQRVSVPGNVQVIRLTKQVDDANGI